MEWLDDMGYIGLWRREVKGWYYEKEAITTLLQAGYQVQYKGELITPTNTIEIIDNRKAQEARDLAALRRKREAEKESLETLYRGIRETGEYMEEADVKKLKTAIQTDEATYQHIHCASLGIKGHTIYGGGEYWMKDSNYFYRIQNNGGDGDMWARNNFSTGGAGAIAYRILLTDAVKTFFEKIAAFETKWTN